VTRNPKPKMKITHRNGSSFMWVRGCYEIQKINGKDYIVSNGGLSFYEPDYKIIIEKIVNLDLTNDNILKFAKKYGLPGTYYYYIETGAYESYVKFTKPIEEHLLLKWERLFGAKSPSGLPSLSVTNGFNIEKRGTRGEIIGIPETKIAEWLTDDKQLWRDYREPLDFLKLAFSEFRHAVEHLINGDYHPRLKLKIELDGTVMISPVTSLLEACYSFLIWSVGTGSKLKQCAGYKKFNCGTCEYGKRFFWQSGTYQLYGKNNCRLYQNERAQRYRRGETKNQKNKEV